MRKHVTVALALAMSFAGMSAASAASYKFHMWNKSSYKVSGFETFEDGAWTKWENASLAAGEDATMDWATDKGDCNVPLKVLFQGYNAEQYTVDWCKVSNIYVTETSVTWD